MESIVNLSVEDLQSFYLRKTFLSKMYTYFSENGYYNLLLRQLVYLMTNTFLLLYTLFLLNCVDWRGLLTNSGEASLSSYIHPEHFFALNFFKAVLFVSYFLFILIKVGSLVGSFYNFKYTRHFFNNILDIQDKDLVNIKWEKVVAKFAETHKNSDINVFFINNKITLKDNYFISLMDKNIIKMNYLCRLMEWNIMFCFINPILGEDFKFDRNFIYLNEKFLRKIKKRIINVVILNFIFMPIIMPFMILQNLFKYGEKFYTNPKLIMSRHWGRLAQWKFRNYNELPHEFKDKIQASYKTADEYSSMFPNRLISTIAEFVVFILSSFLVVLVFISLVNEKTLTDLYIVENKNTLWFLGVMVTIIAIFKGFMKDTKICNMEDTVDKLKESINCLNIEEFFTQYEYHIVSFFKDIAYTIMSPFQLYELYFKAPEIILFLNEATTNNLKLGHTNSYALFNNTNLNDSKSLKSRETFAKNNPNSLINC